jgi:hypothetical protein
VEYPSEGVGRAAEEGRIARDTVRDQNRIGGRWA